MRIKFSCIVLFFTMITICSCSKRYQIIGKYVSTEKYANIILEIKADSTFSYSEKGFHNGCGRFWRGSRTYGNWSLNNKMLILTTDTSIYPKTTLWKSNRKNQTVGYERVEFANIYDRTFYNYLELEECKLKISKNTIKGPVVPRINHSELIWNERKVNLKKIESKNIKGNPNGLL